VASGPVQQVILLSMFVDLNCAERKLNPLLARCQKTKGSLIHPTWIRSSAFRGFAFVPKLRSKRAMLANSAYCPSGPVRETALGDQVPHRPVRARG